MITTDGIENASREFTYAKVKELIRHQQEKYGWEFIFLGANIDAVKEARNIGIRKENAHNYEASEDGIRQIYCVVHESVAESRRGKHKNG